MQIGKCKWSLKTAERACASLLGHIVPMALSCVIKDEKPSYYQRYQRHPLKHNIILYLSQLRDSFPCQRKTTGSSLQRKREIVLAVSWSMQHKGTPTHTSTVHRGHTTSFVLFIYFRTSLSGSLGPLWQRLMLLNAVCTHQHQHLAYINNRADVFKCQSKNKTLQYSV